VVHIILVREAPPTRALARALAPAPRHPVACVRGVESYLRNLRDDRVRVVRVDLTLSLRLRVRLCVDDTV
jgi:hypothetical protein